MKVKRNSLIVIFSVIVMLLIVWLPISPESGLTIEGKTALGILAFAIILWRS